MAWASEGCLVPGLEVNAEPVLPQHSLPAVLALPLALGAARLAASPGAGGASAPASDWCPLVVPVRSLQVRAAWGERPFLPKREPLFFQSPELALPCRRLALWLPVSWQPEFDEVVLIKSVFKHKMGYGCPSEISHPLPCHLTGPRQGHGQGSCEGPFEGVPVTGPGWPGWQS